MKVLVISLLVLFVICYQSCSAITSCPVGEPFDSESNYCNRENGEANCRNYCKATFGGDFQSSKCSDPRPNGLKECICATGCAKADCWGDPHCHNFNRRSFNYQGRCEHVLMKPIRPLKNLPNFEVRMQSKEPFWMKSDAVSMTEKVELSIPSMELNLEFGEILKVNDDPKSTPYTFTTIQGHKELFVKVTTANKGADLEYTITTSFGVIIKGFGAKPGRVPGFTLYIPKHPDLWGNTAGLFGNWDKNLDNDFVDANGIKRNVSRTSPMEEFNFGDSWCIDQSKVTPQHTRETIVKDHRETMENCRRNAEMVKKMSQCNRLNNNDVSKCMGVFEMNQIVESCQVDVCYQTPQDFCNAIKDVNELCDMKMAC